MAADDTCDVLVVGAGMAGLTAALFAARTGLATVVLCPEGPGGPLVSIEQIENYPGFVDPVPGYELCPMLQEQAQTSGARFVAATVNKVGPGASGGWLAETDGGEIATRTVIVASGTAPSELGVPGEQRLAGRGVSHCASCDGPLYVDRDVAVVGNGDDALSEALTLSRCGTRVTMVFEEPDPVGQSAYVTRVLDDPAISLRERSMVREIRGESVVSGLTIEQADAGQLELDLAAVFLYPVRLPCVEYLGGIVDFADDGRVRADVSMRTSAPGIFVAGDVRSEAPGFAVSAAGDGAVAATSAVAYLAAGVGAVTSSVVER